MCREKPTVDTAHARTPQASREQQFAAEQRSTMTTDAPFLLLETDADGTVLATGQTSHTGNQELATRRLTHSHWIGWVQADRHRGRGTDRKSWPETSDTGLVPLYYYSDGDRFAISTSALLLRERLATTDLDWPAIAILLALGNFIDGDTPFADIKALPIRSSLAWRYGQFTVEERTFDIPHLDITYEEAKSQYLTEVRQAIERSLPADGFALGLSGGRDSRHILLELLSLGVRLGRLITSSHYLASSDADTTSASRLAERAGLPISRVFPGSDRIRSERAKNELTEFQTLSHSWGLELGLEFSSALVVYDGMNAGLLFGRSPSVQAIRDESGEVPEDTAEVVGLALNRWFDMPIDHVQPLFTERIFTNETLAEASAASPHPFGSTTTHRTPLRLSDTSTIRPATLHCSPTV